MARRGIYGLHPMIDILLITALAVWIIQPAHGQMMTADSPPLMVEVTPLVPAIVIPLEFDDVQFSLQPTRVGADNMAWDSADDGQTFRRQTKDRTVNLLLYGVAEQVQATPDVQPSNMPQVSRNLKQFMDGHFTSIKKDYFNQDEPDSARLVAGDASFISETMTRGLAQKPAKLAGATVPVGNWTFGGGYTWDEKNPATMQPVKKGMIVGARYNAGKVPVQISYMSTGRDIAGVSTGGGDYAYDNVMLGASIPVKEKWYINTTLQYRNDRNRIEEEQRQVILTFGTKIKF